MLTMNTIVHWGIMGSGIIANKFVSELSLAKDAMRCLREDLLESPMMPLDETLEIMQTMDKLRAQWGLKYEVDHDE